MRDAIAELAHPVLAYGLELRERLLENETLGLLAEQAALKDLLASESEASRWAEFGGEAMEQPAGGSRKRFLGARYALVCWLDELFTSEPAWAREWNERKLEAELYGGNDRAWRFWEQAEMAQARPGTDALEVFFWCVVLGFRGELRSQPDKLQAWTAATRQRLGRVRELTWPYSPDVLAASSAPPLHGWEGLRRMILVGMGTLLVFLPLLTFFLVRSLAR